jgi:hypothetical protein
MIEGLLAVIAVLLILILVRLGAINKTLAQAKAENLNELKEITYQLKLKQ